MPCPFASCEVGPVDMESSRRPTLRTSVSCGTQDRHRQLRLCPYASSTRDSTPRDFIHRRGREITALQ